MKILFERLFSKHVNNDRSTFRLKRIIFTGFSSLGAKGINTIVTLISVPLTLSYLGSERYGMMMTILSFIAMMHYADLGLGLSLHNKIPQLDLKKDQLELQKLVSSTFFLLVFCAIFFAVVFFAIYPMVKWSNLFNVKSDMAIQEAAQCMIIFVCCFSITIPFSIVQKVQGGYQEGYYNEIWKAIGNVIGLFFLFVAIELEYGAPYLILAIYGCSTLFVILNFLFQFLIRRRHLFPSLSFFDKKVVIPLFKEGSMFFVLQFFAAVCNSSDSIIIAKIIGAEAVTEYIIGFKLFLIFMLPVNIFISPMLPAFNDAFSRKEFKWIRKLMINSLSIIISVSIVFMILYYFSSNYIVNIWIGSESSISMSLVFAFSVFILVYNLNIFFSTILSTSYFVKYLFIVYPFTVIGILMLKVFLAIQFGVSGVIWGSIIGLSILFFLPSFLKLRSQNLI